MKTIMQLKDRFPIKGLSHITGGGFIENIPRMIPGGLRLKIKLGAWPVPPIFKLLQEIGEISDASIYNTFNMGIGMVMAVSPEISDEVLGCLETLGEKAYIIGEVTKGEAGVDLC